MKISILGSRGIPNRYGGFEELAEKLAIGLADRGHEVIVYIPSDHPISGWKYDGVTLIRISNPERFLGSFGQFIYDLGASLHCRVAKPDVILELGYTSSSVWFWLLPRTSRVITNMDGLEWKRSKYNRLVKRFLKRAEYWAGKHSHLMVADNPQIETYLHSKFKNQTIYIPYGADIPKVFHEKTLGKYAVEPGRFHLLIARMEPENHIKEIIQGVLKSNSTLPILIVGSLNKYGKRLKKKYAGDKRIQFLGAIYQKEELNALRYFSRYYFHGHSVGGTNPSLLEAMACNANIMAHNNPFNKTVLNGQASFFSSPFDIALLLDGDFDQVLWEKRHRKNVSAIRDKYNWRIIIEQYEIAMQQAVL